MSTQNVQTNVDDTLLAKSLKVNYPNLVDLLKDEKCREEIRQRLAEGYPFIRDASPELMEKIWDQLETASILHKQLTQSELDILFEIHAKQVEALQKEIRILSIDQRYGYSPAGH